MDECIKKKIAVFTKFNSRGTRSPQERYVVLDKSTIIKLNKVKNVSHVIMHTILCRFHSIYD